MQGDPGIRLALNCGSFWEGGWTSDRVTQRKYLFWRKKDQMYQSCFDEI